MTGSSGMLGLPTKRRAIHQFERQETCASTMESPLQNNTNIASHLAEFVPPDQFLHFVSACKGWKACWGDRPSVTRAITSDTSIAQLRFSFDCGLTWSGKFSTACAASGRLDLLAHARASGCGSGEETCATAAAAGSLPILEFLRAKGCKWNDSAFLDAAEHGHLDVIKWLLLNGCPLRASNRFSVGAKAAGGGHLALLKWLVVDERLVKWDEAMSVYAAQNGHIAVLEFGEAKRTPD